MIYHDRLALMRRRYHEVHDNFTNNCRAVKSCRLKQDALLARNIYRLYADE